MYITSFGIKRFAACLLLFLAGIQAQAQFLFFDEPQEMFAPSFGLGMDLVMTKAELPSDYAPSRKGLTVPRYFLELGTLHFQRYALRLRGVSARYRLQRVFDYTGTDGYADITFIKADVYYLDARLVYPILGPVAALAGVGFGFYASQVNFLTNALLPSYQKKNGPYMEGSLGGNIHLYKFTFESVELPMSLGIQLQFPFFKPTDIGRYTPLYGAYLSYANFSKLGTQLTFCMRIRRASSGLQPKPKPIPKSMPKPMPTPKSIAKPEPKPKPSKTVPQPAPEVLKSSAQRLIPKPQEQFVFRNLDDDLNLYGVENPSEEGKRCFRMYFGEEKRPPSPNAALALACELTGVAKIKKDPIALFIRGKAYYDGDVVEQDYAEAAKWFKKAASKGNVFGQHILGSMYESGTGVVQNDVEALKWIRRAAEAGHVPSQFNMGKLLSAVGGGEESNLSSAADWYQKAAERGFGEAQYRLGVIYHKGLGVSKDMARAIAWYQMAAEQGNADAQFDLGQMHAQGREVEKNLEATVNWYHKAANLGHKQAQYELGLLYRSGQAGVKDPVIAAALFEKAAEQGHTEAQYILGMMYANGEGVKKDNPTAVKWFDLAGKAGHAKAEVELKKILGRHVIEIEKVEKVRKKKGTKADTSQE